ncbi:MAG: flagellar motor protein MotB [Desulfotignum sp.]
MFFAAVAVGPVSAQVSKVFDPYVHVEACRHEIALLDRELQQLDQDRQWLENKISTMSSMNRPVSPTLYQSVAYKQNRLAALAKSRVQYKAVLAGLTAKLPDPKTTASGQPDSETKDSGGSPHNGVHTGQPFGSDIRAAHDLMDRMKAYHIDEWFDILPAGPRPDVVTSTLPILFSSGSAVVAKEYHGFFKKIAAFIKDQPVYIVVDGFADLDPIKTQKYPSNFELGAARAANVIHVLTDCGVDPDRFKAATTGKYRFPDERPMSAEKSMERYVRITLIPS